MKKLLTWTAVTLLTAALLDPLMYAMLEEPVPWLRDVLMFCGGVGCLYLLFRFRHDL